MALAAAGACAAAALASPAAAPPSQLVFAANRSPQVNGEIYRVNPDGTSVDLSDSPALDADPAVSPDGKHVAFVSTRGGHVAVYLVGTDGRGRRRLSQSLWAATPNDGLAASFTWTADSRAFALAANGSNPGEGGLYVWDAAGWRTLARRATNLTGSPAWSRDGSMLAYATNDDATVHVLSASGRRLWSAVSAGPPAWGGAARLVVATNSTTISVYDRSGRALATLPGHSFAWSPSGAFLAMVNGKRLQVRRGGLGKPFLDARLAITASSMTFNNGLRWVGNGHLLLLGDNGWIGYDVAHRRLWPLPAAVANYNGIFLADGSIAYWRPQPGSPTTHLMILPPGSTSARSLATAPICGDEYPSWTQAIPHARAVVYQSACSNPSADLYAVYPGGSGLRRLTDATTDERQPSVSPDGSSVVYVQQQVAERCDGCVSTLWRMPTAGGTPEQLTFHAEQDTLRFDVSPSWSPDGQQLAFLRSGFDVPPTLYVMPAGGGGVSSLRVEGWDAVWGPREIAYITNTAKPNVKTLDPASGAAHSVAKNGTGASLAWSPDGRLAYLLAEGKGRTSIVMVGSVAKAIALGPLLTPGADVQGLTWSPDGTHFAFTATDANGVGEVYTISTDGKGLRQLTRNLGAVGAPSWR
jgi:Tol biopolymer transport system component